MAGRESDTRDTSQSRNDVDKRSNKFLLGALIGGMLGATAALLFAPKPGKEFRNKLMNKTTLMGETVWERSNEIASMTKEKTALFSKGVVSKTKNLSLSDSVEEWGEEETNYISLTDRDTKKSSNGSIKEVDVRKKLEEAKKALEEEEKRIMQ